MIWRRNSVLLLKILFCLLCNLVHGDTDILYHGPEKGWSIYNGPVSAQILSWFPYGTDQYSVCDTTTTDREPTNWLRTDFIDIKDAIRVDIRIIYAIRKCKPSYKYCKENFKLYAYLTSKTSPKPNPLLTPFDFIDVAKPTVIPDRPVGPADANVMNVSIKAKSKGMFLAFYDQGTCVSLLEIYVSFNYCPEKSKNLVTFVRTVSPYNDSSPLQVEGKCSDPHSQNITALKATCTSQGNWVQDGKASCMCKPGYEFSKKERVHNCKSCTIGKYKSSLDNTLCQSCPNNSRPGFSRASCVCNNGFYRLPNQTNNHPCKDYDLRTSSTTTSTTTTTNSPLSISGLVAAIVTPIVLLVIGGAIIVVLLIRRRLVNSINKQSELVEPRVEDQINNIQGEETIVDGVYEEIDALPEGPEYFPLLPRRRYDVPRDSVDLLFLLGSGNFGEVFKGKMEGHGFVAVKRLKESASEKEKTDILKELETLKNMKPHPYVVSLIGYCTEEAPILIILEYLPYGDLLGYLRKSRGYQDDYNTGEKTPTSSISGHDMMKVAWMIADGMSHLEKMKCVHRDLAARNILVGENQVCKISDFGLARKLDYDDIYVLKSKSRLPIKWMPPESLFFGESTIMSDV